MIMQSTFEVDLCDTVKTLLAKSYSHEIKLLDRLFNDLDLLLDPIPQDESLATTYITKRTPKDSIVEHSISLLEAYMMSRAFDDEKYPGYFIYNGYKIVFKMEASPLSLDDQL